MPNWLSRILVAAVALPLVLGLVWLGGWWVFALAAAVGLLAMHEYALMTRPLRPLVIAGYASIAACLLGTQLGGLGWGTAGFLSVLPLSFLLKGIADTKQSATVAIASTTLGAAWIGLGLAHLLLLRAIPHDARLASYAVLLAIFAGDTFAYLVGRLAGRHKLAPAISPGKTWEGFLGGTAATVFVAWIALYNDRHEFLPNWQAIVLGVVIAVAGPVGDLFESALKRDMRVKDTGRLMGGHGGMLDRVDSLLFAGVASYWLLAAFGHA
jgi:phosphatidate cytidylyltransferase